jgi:hypothetical protein
MPPLDLLDESMGGSWSIAASEIGVGSGSVMRATLDVPPEATSTSGTGSGGLPVIIDTYTPEFRFQNLVAATLDFDFDIDSEGCVPFGNCVESLLVTLHTIVSGLPVDETLLWEFFTFDPPTDIDPISIVAQLPGDEPPPDHVDGETVYRIRLRVRDQDEDKTTLVGAEIDNLALTFAEADVYGDYNSDGIVNAADYVIWRNHEGQEFSLPNEHPDVVTPGFVDQEDYDYWAQSFGSGSGAGGAAQSKLVPEPPSVLLILCLAGVTAMRRWCGRCGTPGPDHLVADSRDR